MLDLTHVLRTLVRSPGHAVTVVLTLAFGIGANTAIFSLIYGILLQPLPYRDGDELMLVRQQTAEGDQVGISIAEFFDYRDQSEKIDLVEYHAMSFTLLGQSEPQRVSTGVVSHDFFQLLGTAPTHGRLFLAEDEHMGAEAVLLLSHGYFQRFFNGDPSVVGRVFEMNDKPHTVVGVLPPIPQFPNEHDVYMPTVACPFRAAGQERMHERRGAFRALTVFGRVREDADTGAVGAEVKGIAQRFEEQHPETYGRFGGLGVETVPLFDELTQNARSMLVMLLAATGLVLLLACTNVANMTMARLIARRREMAVRAALGAGRWQLARRSVMEALLLSLVGGTLGVLLAWGGLDLLKTFAAPLSPRAATVELSGVVLVFAVVLAVVTGLIFGAAPVLGQRLNLVTALHDGGHGAAGGAGRPRVRGLLVTLQVAVSAVLLVGAGLLLRSFDRLQRLDPGFNPDHVLAAQVSLNWSKYNTAELSRDFFQRLLESFEGHPGVESAAVGSIAPLTQQGGNTQGVRLEGRPVDEDKPEPTVNIHFVSQDFFDTLEIPLERGRFFETRDHAEAPDVVVINATMALRFWPDEDPIGRRLSLDRGETWMEVVGVAGDVRHFELDRAAAEEIYRPLAQTGFSNRLLLRTRTEPAALAQDVRQAVYGVDPEQPVERIETLENSRSASLATPRTTAFLLALFAALALGITAAGVAGLVAWSVGQRTREIGVRMALGAQRRDVLGMVLYQGLAMVAVGLVVGLGGALLWSRLLADLLFETSTFDPATMITVATVLFGVGAVACLPPAQRAVEVDPNIAVKAE